MHLLTDTTSAVARPLWCAKRARIGPQMCIFSDSDHEPVTIEARSGRCGDVFDLVGRQSRLTEKGAVLASARPDWRVHSRAQSRLCYLIDPHPRVVLFRRPRTDAYESKEPCRHVPATTSGRSGKDAFA